MNIGNNKDNSRQRSCTTGEFIKNKPFLNFSPQHTLYDIVNSMRNQNVFVALILERNKLVGLLTEHGILLYLLSWFADPSEHSNHVKVFSILTAGDVMIENPDTLEADMPVEEAYKMLMKSETRFMPVLSKGKPVGIVEHTELISYMEEKSRKELEAKDMILSYLMHHENYGCL